MKRLCVLLLLTCLVFMPMLQQSVYAGENDTDISDLRITAVSSYLNNTAVLTEDGNVWAWGDNSYGQLGAGDKLKFSYKPLRIEGFENSVSVSVGNGFILALKGNGTVWGVGSNLHGQISDTRAADKVYEPIQVPKVSSIKAISAGINYSMASRTDGSVYIWGSYINRGSSTRKYPPELVRNFSDSESVAALRYNAVAIKSAGSVWTFRGTVVKAEAIDNIPNIAAISEGIYRTFGLDSEGDVWYWSTNGQGAVKLTGVSGVKELCDAGGFKTLALDNTGRVWIWDNEELVPRRVFGIDAVSAISAGDRHVAVLKSDGTLWAWGDNNVGQLGYGANFLEPEPIVVPDFKDVKTVAASQKYTLALKKDGTVWAWGDNSYGQLGVGTKVESLIPLKIEGLDNIISISAGNTHALALKSDGTLWAWGSNGAGELGDGTYENRLSPVQVTGIDNVMSACAGDGFTIALKSNRTLWVWGNSGYTRKNDPTDINRSIPRNVKEVNNIKSISAGKDFAIAIKNDESIWGLGSNTYGQMDGIGAEDDEGVKIPKAIVGLRGIRQIAAGSNFSLALKSDGQVFAWGSNDYAQLGLESRKVSKGKYIVRGLTGVSIISAGGNHCYVIKKDGSVWAWGDNSYGQIGAVDMGIVESPMQLKALKDIKYISAGYNYTAAVKENGTLEVWGNNSYGQLGIGKKGIIKSDSPVQIKLGQ